MSLMMRAMGVRHSVLGAYQGSQIFMLMHYMETTEGREFQPAITNDILRHSETHTKMKELTKFMQDRGLCTDKFGEPDEEEIVLAYQHASKYMKEKKTMVILVTTNRAVHEFQEPMMGKKTQLKHLNKIFYERFAVLSRNHSGQAVHIEYFLDSGKITKAKVVYVMHEYAEIDRFCKLIACRAPRHGRTRMCMWLEDCHLNFLFQQSELFDEGEEMESSYLFSRASMMGTVSEDVYMVVTTTKLHFFKADFSYWHRLAPTTPLPWWSDKSRFMPMPGGVRGWDIRYLQRLKDPIELKDVSSHRVKYDDKSRMPQLVLVFGDKDKDAKKGGLISFGKDPLKDAVILTFYSYANCCHCEQLITMGMMRTGAIKGSYLVRPGA